MFHTFYVRYKVNYKNAGCKRQWGVPRVGLKCTADRLFPSHKIIFVFKVRALGKWNHLNFFFYNVAQSMARRSSLVPWEFWELTFGEPWRQDIPKPPRIIAVTEPCRRRHAWIHPWILVVLILKTITSFNGIQKQEYLNSISIIQINQCTCIRINLFPN